LGLRQWHSHRFIHGFFETFKYLGIPVVVHCELFNNSSSDNGTLWESLDVLHGAWSRTVGGGGLDKHAFSRTVRSLFPSTRQRHLTPSELILTGLGLTPESYRLL
jgi:hypothetical protein